MDEHNKKPTKSSSISILKCSLDRSPGWSRDARSGYSQSPCTDQDYPAGTTGKITPTPIPIFTTSLMYVCTQRPPGGPVMVVLVSGLSTPGLGAHWSWSHGGGPPHEASWPPPSLCLDPLLCKLTHVTSLSTLQTKRLVYI